MRGHPLAALTGGGWVRSAARLAVGVAIVAVAVKLTGPDAYRPLLEPRVLPFVAAGAALHLLQRAARIRKWQRLMEGAALLPRSYLDLLRVQLIGLVANLLLPTSEALKVWAVSKDRRDIVPASESLVADLALHTALIGGLGLLGALAVAALPLAAWVASSALAGGGAAVALVTTLRARARGRPLRSGSGAVHGYNALETSAQLAIYALAAAAVGVPAGTLELLALAPVLYLADLLMLTPSGLGLREALFGAAVVVLPQADSSIGVAMGLSISAMIFTASVLGGGVALLIPKQ
jgi:hypothetical protein